MGSEGGRVSWKAWRIWLWLESQEHLLGECFFTYPGSLTVGEVSREVPEQTS